MSAMGAYAHRLEFAVSGKEVSGFAARARNRSDVPEAGSEGEASATIWVGLGARGRA